MTRRERPLKTLGPLFADKYAFTMGQALFTLGTHNTRTAFNMFIRKNPFEGGYLLTGGLSDFLEWLSDWRVLDEDIDYLRSCKDGQGKPLYTEAFLTFLKEARLELDIKAMPEGTIAFPHEPIVRVEGPVWQCLAIESALLTFLNQGSLVATKASRVVFAADGDPVFEGGMRRAHSLGSLLASKMAYMAGCIGTSNMKAAQLYGIPDVGTFAHAFVMLHHSELEAFENYAKAMPHGATFLVDTYNTIEGVKKVIDVAQRLLVPNGHKLLGIRLDSGDLAHLSKKARKLLDAAGFTDTLIVASNDLTEYLILDLKKVQGARINSWLVGTNLVVSSDQPALGGVYKLAAVWEDSDVIRDVMKLSEDRIKISNPGVLNVARYYRPDGMFWKDMIVPEGTDLSAGTTSIDLVDDRKRTTFNTEVTYQLLLVPIMENGTQVYTVPVLKDSRTYALNQLAALDESHRRFANPHLYHVGLEADLHARKEALIDALKHAA
ncbi:MAG: nicotinate phosphoribosyltransferase [Proteobacteria bacterium]|nr:nicotinate phosphoribosyltransferase [Pseudomonadota bacterium]